MKKIPSEVRRVINELVEFQKTHKEPPDLAYHLSKLFSSQRGRIEAKFFQKVYDILRTDAKQFAHYSAPGFKQGLEKRYQGFVEEQTKRQVSANIQAQQSVKRHGHINSWPQQNVERQEQPKKPIQAQQRIAFQPRREPTPQMQMQARATFRSLGNRITGATTRDELVHLSKERARQVPLMGIKFEYENHCWRCEARISSQIHPKCPDCPGYICSSCGNCLCDFPIFLRKKKS